MRDAQVKIEGWSMKCSGHNYITLFYDGKFVHCFDNDLHIENAQLEGQVTDTQMALVEVYEMMF